MPNKLTYFGVHGRTRPCRMLLDHAKVKYEDCRVTPEIFAELKVSKGLTGLPVWEDGSGMLYDESKALLRYLATIYGYYPKDLVCAHKADCIVDKLYSGYLDTWVPIFVAGDNVDPAKFKEAMEMVVMRLGEELKHGKKFLCGDKITIADFAAFGVLTSWAWNPAWPYKDTCAAGAKEACAANPVFEAWMMCMMAENKAHLDNSPAAPY